MIDGVGLRALAMALPEAEEALNGAQIAYSVGGKGFAWAYVARPAPKARRVLVPGVFAVRCRIETKEMLIEAAPDRFFDDDHYRGYPAVLVRLAEIEAEELAGLLREAWRIVEPKAVGGLTGKRTRGGSVVGGCQTRRSPCSDFPISQSLLEPSPSKAEN